MSSERPQGERRAPLWATDAVRQPEFESMAGGTPIQCQFCVGQTFRRSRLRAGDLPQLLLMRYPVRCTRCSQRQTVSFTVASVSVPSYIRHRHRSGGGSVASPAKRSSSENVPGA